MQLSSTLFAKARSRIPGGVNSPVRAFSRVGVEPFFVRQASGSTLTTVEGRTLIDYVGTWGPAILGHAPPCVLEAIKQTAPLGLSFGMSHPLEPLMAETLTTWVPSLQKVRMVNSGTEATMSCIRLARGYTQRDLIIKFEGCYHGHVDSLLVAAGSGAMTHGKPDSAGIPQAFAEKTLCLPYNDSDALLQAFDSHKNRIAAVIVESYPANIGLIFPKEGFLQRLSELTKAHGALLIFDEVMTGFRLAKGGVASLENITPDLLAFGKVIGGGLPVGAFGGRAEIMDYLAPLGPVYQAGTLSGNPLALAAGLAQLNTLEQSNGFERLDVLGKRLRNGVLSILSEKKLPYIFHSKGSMFSLFFSKTGKPIDNLKDVQDCDEAAFNTFFKKMLKAGIFIAPSCYETGFISLAHSEEDIDNTLNAIADSL